ncbi:MAG: YaeQ family protein [Steroidobacteraceae bacterium]
MALGATVHVFTVRLSDVDRGVYDTLELRLARHPSESAEYLVTRLLAYCLEFTEGIAFSKGLSDPDEPAIVVRDLTGVLRGWIEVGAPEALRLHKAAKAADRVAVYPTRDATPWLARLAGERIHRSEHIEIRAIDSKLIAALAAKLERRLDFDLSVSEQTLYVSMGGETLTGNVELLTPGALSLAPHR